MTRDLFWHLLASLKRVALGYLAGGHCRHRARRAGRQQQVGHARARSAVPGVAHDSAAGVAAAVAGRVHATASPRRSSSFSSPPSGPSSSTPRWASATSRRTTATWRACCGSTAPSSSPRSCCRPPRRTSSPGLRIGIGLSWLAIVAAEMLIGGVGIGFFIWDAWNSSLISDIILALVYVGHHRLPAGPRRSRSWAD